MKITKQIQVNKNRGYKMWKFLIVALSSVTLFSCSSIVYEEGMKLGMTKEELFKNPFLGEPQITDKYGENDEVLYWDKHALIFENGILKNKFKVDLNQSFHFEVSSESLFGEDPKDKIATIFPSVTGMSKDDLEFRKVESIVASILRENGYKISDDLNKVDTIVFVNYGISVPNVVAQTWSEPVYDYVPAQSLSTTHKISNQWGQNLGSVTSETTQNGGYGSLQYRGERLNSTTVKSYIRHLTIEGANYKHYKQTNKIKNFWKVTAKSEGSSDDLNKVIPALALSAKYLIGKDSNGKVSNVIYLVDPRLGTLTNSKRIPASEEIKNK